TAPLRVWVPGCSTGEEVYSLAILLIELCGERSRPLQLFGSDLSERAIECARQGQYSEAIAAQVGEERLARFFRRENGGYRINRDVRERCVFVRHDLVTDPPFSKLDLVSDAVRSALDVQREVDHVLLARYAPACVIIDENLEVVQFRGRTGAYLEAPPG